MIIGEIFINWLRGNNFEPFASHNVEVDLPIYGRMMFGISHNGGSYSREWRRIRQDHNRVVLNREGYEVVEAQYDGEKHWRFIKLF